MVREGGALQEVEFVLGYVSITGYWFSELKFSLLLFMVVASWLVYFVTGPGYEKSSYWVTE